MHARCEISGALQPAECSTTVPSRQRDRLSGTSLNHSSDASQLAVGLQPASSPSSDASQLVVMAQRPVVGSFVTRISSKKSYGFAFGRVKRHC